MPTLSRREFNKALAGTLLSGTALSSGLVSRESTTPQPGGTKRPNIVFVCTDQHSAQYAGFARHPLVRTPHLDRIAAGGTVFTSAYCGSPLCVPGRSSMMTGMYPSDVNSFCNSTVYDGSHPTWGKRLRESGYHCWAVGKQDLNPAVDLGFVEVAVDHGHAKGPDITSLFRRPVGYRIGEREGIDGSTSEKSEGDSRGGRRASVAGRDLHDTQTAVQFIRKEAAALGKPWVAFVGLRQPHPPWIGRKEYFDYYLPLVQPPQVPLEELEQLPLPYQVMRHFKRIATPIPEARIRRAIAAYFSMITEVDSCVGEIYRALEETGQAGNTFFIYTSDHGESLGEHGLWLKNNLYEGAVRIPLVISGPQVPQGKKVAAPVSHVDLVATMLEWATVSKPGDLRGTSLSPLLAGGSEEGARFVYAESHSEGNPTGSCLIRKGEWKLIHFSYYEDYLFNLKDDPKETRNRATDPSAQEVMKDLQATLHRLVDPEEVTERAFAAQAKILQGFADRMNEEELFALFKSRLGDGQARVMARALKHA
ncbi:MAG TPA: sulfatase-like hydrolase/transferase [Bacteroidota bacterium]